MHCTAFTVNSKVNTTISYQIIILHTLLPCNLYLCSSDPEVFSCVFKLILTMCDCHSGIKGILIDWLVYCLSRNKRFYQFLTYNSLNVITFTVSSEANVHTCTHVACNGSKKQPSTQNPWYTSFFSSNDEHYQDCLLYTSDAADE